MCSFVYMCFTHRQLDTTTFQNYPRKRTVLICTCAQVHQCTQPLPLRLIFTCNFLSAITVIPIFSFVFGAVEQNKINIYSIFTNEMWPRANKFASGEIRRF